MQISFLFPSNTWPISLLFVENENYFNLSFSRFYHFDCWITLIVWKNAIQTECNCQNVDNFLVVDCSLDQFDIFVRAFSSFSLLTPFETEDFCLNCAEKLTLVDFCMNLTIYLAKGLLNYFQLQKVANAPECCCLDFNK